MAKIYHHERQLEKDLQQLKQRKVVSRLLCSLALGIVIVIAWHWQQVLLTFIAVSIVGLYLISQCSLSKQLGKVTAGLAGEDRALEVLRNLPATYSIFPDIQIVVDGRTSQLDTIVVGPTGIFVVEVKNHAGVITGHTNEQQLLQIKHDGYKKTIYNPVKQVATHTYRLHRYLYQHGVDFYKELFILPMEQQRLMLLTIHRHQFFRSTKTEVSACFII
ncbi:nuclease-related domain-containing protein [Lysinibacillus parviboronicapiens]|uniref:nuclease-related domain-containing protein n=1 Tax=Lysinibacillus parviboronicapiens TaxID=436516 RepID=UPI0006D167B3|nr:nuclease-related domain-containing protein [Lysinibacillus parviboronicapiens]